MKVTKEYEWNEVVWKDLNIGDSVQLPEFTVPEMTIAGDIELHFEDKVVKDTATVYSITNDEIHLVFDHALFKSAMDLNNATEWKKTQLRAYLRSAFKNAMRDVGVPVSEVSLLSKDELFEEEALPFFKNGRNRIAFENNDSTTVWYWLKNATFAAYFCRADYYGNVDYGGMSYMHGFVRPCFVVNTKQQDN